MNSNLKLLIGGAGLAALMAVTPACGGKQKADQGMQGGCGPTSQPMNEGGCGACGACGGCGTDYKHDDGGCGGCGGCGG